MTATKACFRCLQEKPLSDFYRHPLTADGLLGKCKDCTRTDVSTNRSVRAPQYKAYEHARNARPDRLEARRRWHRNNPAKGRAHQAVARAIKAGLLTRGACVRCGHPRTHGHHPDYSRRLDVVWLCPRDHARHHFSEAR